jgi:hypothetical protein
MNEAQAEAGTPSPDDTAAFQRFYAEAPAQPAKRPTRGMLYRVLIGWWRDAR